MNEELNDNQVNDLIAIALNAQAGDVLSVGGEMVTLGFLRLDAEDALADILAEVLTRTPGGGDLREMFTLARGELRRAAAVILADYREPDASDPVEARADALAWIETTRGVTTSDLIDLVVAQVQLNKLGEALGKLLTGGALLGSALGQRPPVT